MNREFSTVDIQRRPFERRIGRMRSLVASAVCCLALTLNPVHSAADDLDSASTEALGKTQQLLRSQSERQQYIDKNAPAQSANKKVEDLTSNPKTQDDIYNLSSDIFGDMVKTTGGDTAKQTQMLNDAMKDPEGFYNKLTPEQKAQVRGIANTIE